MKKQIIFLCSLLVLLVASCKSEQKPKQEVYNPFATPEGCVKEYLDATDSCDVARMLNCYSYDPKYERIVREGLQKSLDDKEREKRYRSEGYHEKVDSVKLKEKYPNSCIVTVYFTYGYKPEDNTSWSYALNLVKDGDNWKLEAQLSYTISAS